MPSITPPFYPIIYVRGYAMRQSDIDDTVSTPYMGFNQGSSKVRQEWDGSVHRHIFESPLIRLMKNYGYRDVYTDGLEIEDTIPCRSIIIHRYYEQADSDLGTDGRPSIMKAARELGELILKIRDQVCSDDQAAAKQFKVCLAAHSMGGLICRGLLQNDKAGPDEARKLVDKVFTYGTPHNGIEIAGRNVPGFLGIWDISNFNRKRIAEYLNLQDSDGPVNHLDGKFDPSRFFCLVGTNHRDYSAARFAVGPMSDGLVKIKNATVNGAPRAFTFHSHSGPYGLVNSEEGYQNLVRFLFGDTLIKGILEVDELPLPPAVQKAYDNDREIRTSYYFESTVTPRGALSFKLSERTVNTSSAIFRTFDELFHPEKEGLSQPRSPFLFSAYLDSSKITHGRTIVFTLDLAVRTTEYRIDRKLFFDKRIPEENLFRDKITIRATRVRANPTPAGDDRGTDAGNAGDSDAGAGGDVPGSGDISAGEGGNRDDHGNGWNIRYILTDEEWGEKRGTAAPADETGTYIPVESGKGFRAKLRLRIGPWNK